MGLVQFREDDEVLDFLRSEGINPNALSRELLDARVRKMRAQSRLAELQNLRRDLGDAVELIRESREEH